MKKIFKYSIFTLIAVAIGITTSYAGSLTPPGIPAKTMYTLGDLYTLIDTGTSTASTDFVTPGSASPTFHSLTDLVNAFNGNIKTLSNTTTTVAYGIYASTTLNSVDADLSPENIVSGKNIFGVVGTSAASAPSHIWQTDPNLQLCFDSGPSLNCRVGTGLTDPDGYGAKDYCSHLGLDGSTLNATEQNIWHLPTSLELINAYLAGNPGNSLDFITGSPGYLSSTEMPGAPYVTYIVSMNFGRISGEVRNLPYFRVRCVR